MSKSFVKSLLNWEKSLAPNSPARFSISHSSIGVSHQSSSTLDVKVRHQVDKLLHVTRKHRVIRELVQPVEALAVIPMGDCLEQVLCPQVPKSPANQSELPYVLQHRSGTAFVLRRCPEFH